MPDFPYSYEFPLPKVKNAPVPSQADYSPQNCAWVVEMFAGILGRGRDELVLRYENNTPDNPDDDIYVSHPNDRNYGDEAARKGQEGSPEMRRYEAAAKRSKRLRDFMESSPAGIDYFQ